MLDKKNCFGEKRLLTQKLELKPRYKCMGRILNTHVIESWKYSFSNGFLYI